MPPEAQRQTACFLDKVTVRMPAPPTAAEFACLRANSKDVRIRSGRLISNSNATLALSIVAPNAIALETLASQRGAFANYVEVAADVICTTEDEASALLWRVAAHFVHPRHRHHQMVWQPDGFYTGQRRPGRRFVVYIGRPSKITGHAHCLHVEGRHHGSVAVRQIGVHSVRDLINFDFDQYWAKHLQLYAVDLDLLGRTYMNRIRKERRQKFEIDVIGPITYRKDRRVGGLLYRHHSVDPETGFRSVQRFIDEFGRGDYLVRLPIRSPSHIGSLI